MWAARKVSTQWPWHSSCKHDFSSMDVELLVTSDGSHTLHNTVLNETYHSTHGALQESLHVFIRSGFDYVADRFDTVRILEIGFGTGLNALLTVQAAREMNREVVYTGVEAFPLDPRVVSELNYPGMLDNVDAATWFSQIHSAPWGDTVAINSNFTLTKLNSRIQDLDLAPESFEVVYFDAFAPQKQPEMWTADVLNKVAASLTDGGCLVTYCAKGQVKRDLRSAGLDVETLAGPPGKREMIRATRRKT